MYRGLLNALSLLDSSFVSIACFSLTSEGEGQGGPDLTSGDLLCTPTQ